MAGAFGVSFLFALGMAAFTYNYFSKRATANDTMKTVVPAAMMFIVVLIAGTIVFSQIL